MGTSVYIMLFFLLWHMFEKVPDKKIFLFNKGRIGVTTGVGGRKCVIFREGPIRGFKHKGHTQFLKESKKFTSVCEILFYIVNKYFINILSHFLSIYKNHKRKEERMEINKYKNQDNVYCWVRREVMAYC